MKIAVGLIEGVREVSTTLEGAYRDAAGRSYPPGSYRFSNPVRLEPLDPDTCAFVLDDFRIGTGFHWERSQRRSFRGDLRVIHGRDGVTAINDVPLEAYIESVIASEMSPDSPSDLLRAHAVVSRSWIVAQLTAGAGEGTYHRRSRTGPNEWEIIAWYGREGHTGFDVCADDHCQRYQGIPPAGTESARAAVLETRHQFLVYGGQICDARFSKCCGGVTENFRSAWDDREIPYLQAVCDGPGNLPRVDADWIRSVASTAYCNTRDPSLLERVFTRYDQETADFFRWRVDYSRTALAELIGRRSGIDIGDLLSIEPLERGPSGRVVRLRIEGSRSSLTLGKELEIRRVLSSSHLYSSAFVVEQQSGRVVLYGAGWGHGVGLCQVGAAVMAERGHAYRNILRHYYPGTEIEERA